MTTIAALADKIRERITHHTRPPVAEGPALAAALNRLRTAQAGNLALAEQRHWLDADDDTRFPVPGDVRWPLPDPDDGTDALVAEVIRDLTGVRTAFFPAVTTWEVGQCHDGLPLLSARLMPLPPGQVEKTLVILAGGAGTAMPPGRRLTYEDPARIAVEFSWPEPKSSEQDQPVPRAMVQVWAPAYPSGGEAA